MRRNGDHTWPRYLGSFRLQAASRQRAEYTSSGHRQLIIESMSPPPHYHVWLIDLTSGRPVPVAQAQTEGWGESYQPQAVSLAEQMIRAHAVPAGDAAASLTAWSSHVYRNPSRARRNSGYQAGFSSRPEALAGKGKPQTVHRLYFHGQVTPYYAMTEARAAQLSHKCDPQTGRKRSRFEGLERKPRKPRSYQAPDPDPIRANPRFRSEEEEEYIPDNQEMWGEPYIDEEDEEDDDEATSRRRERLAAFRRQMRHTPSGDLPDSVVQRLMRAHAERNPRARRNSTRRPQGTEMADWPARIGTFVRQEEEVEALTGRLVALEYHNEIQPADIETIVIQRYRSPYWHISPHGRRPQPTTTHTTTAEARGKVESVIRAEDGIPEFSHPIEQKKTEDKKKAGRVMRRAARLEKERGITKLEAMKMAWAEARGEGTKSNPRARRNGGFPEQLGPFTRYHHTDRQNGYLHDVTRQELQINGTPATGYEVILLPPRGQHKGGRMREVDSAEDALAVAQEFVASVAQSNPRARGNSTTLRWPQRIGTFTKDPTTGIERGFHYSHYHSPGTPWQGLTVVIERVPAGWVMTMYDYQTSAQPKRRGPVVDEAQALDAVRELVAEGEAELVDSNPRARRNTYTIAPKAKSSNPFRARRNSGRVEWPQTIGGFTLHYAKGTSRSYINYDTNQELQINGGDGIYEIVLLKTGGVGVASFAEAETVEEALDTARRFAAGVAATNPRSRRNGEGFAWQYLKDGTIMAPVTYENGIIFDTEYDDEEEALPPIDAILLVPGAGGKFTGYVRRAGQRDWVDHFHHLGGPQDLDRFLRQTREQQAHTAQARAQYLGQAKQVARLMKQGLSRQAAWEQVRGGSVSSGSRPSVPDNDESKANPRARRNIGRLGRMRSQVLGKRMPPHWFKYQVMGTKGKVLLLDRDGLESALMDRKITKKAYDAALAKGMYQPTPGEIAGL